VTSKINWDPIFTTLASEIGRLEVAWLCTPENVDKADGLRCLTAAREIALECGRLTDDLELRILNLEKAWGRRFENH